MIVPRPTPSVGRRARDLGVVLFSLLATCGLLETGLRVAGVAATPAYTQPVDPTAPYLHYRADHAFRFARDWRGTASVDHHANDHGFVVPWDFGDAIAGPGFASEGRVGGTVALLGDSYVEALHVGPESSIGARLQDATAATVLPLATSGASLAQYLGYLRLAQERFAPDRYMFVIVENDFDESLLARQALPGRFYFDEAQGMRATLVNFQPSTLLGLLQRSHLLQYLIKNLAVGRQLAALRGSGPSPGLDDATVERSRAAIRHFLSEIERRVPDTSRVLFVVDGRRRSLYLTEHADAATGIDPRDTLLLDFVAQASAAGFAIADLQKSFAAHHERTGERLEFSDDYHWNATGHELAARAVLDSGFLER